MIVDDLLLANDTYILCVANWYDVCFTNSGFINRLNDKVGQYDDGDDECNGRGFRSILSLGVVYGS